MASPFLNQKGCEAVSIHGRSRAMFKDLLQNTRGGQTWSYWSPRTSASRWGGGLRLPRAEGRRACPRLPFSWELWLWGEQGARGGSTCGPAHAAAISCPHGAAPPPPRAHRAAGETMRVSERLKSDSGRKPSFAPTPVLLNRFRVTLSPRSPRRASPVRGHLPAQCRPCSECEGLKKRGNRLRLSSL